MIRLHKSVQIFSVIILCFAFLLSYFVHVFVCINFLLVNSFFFSQYFIASSFFSLRWWHQKSTFSPFYISIFFYFTISLIIISYSQTSFLTIMYNFLFLVFINFFLLKYLTYSFTYHISSLFVFSPLYYFRFFMGILLFHLILPSF